LIAFNGTLTAVVAPLERERSGAHVSGRARV
jgi:hypothetical protein